MSLWSLTYGLQEMRQGTGVISSLCCGLLEMRQGKGDSFVCSAAV